MQDDDTSQPNQLLINEYAPGQGISVSSYLKAGTRRC